MANIQAIVGSVLDYVLQIDIFIKISVSFLALLRSMSPIAMEAVFKSLRQVYVNFHSINRAVHAYLLVPLAILETYQQEFVKNALITVSFV